MRRPRSCPALLISAPASGQGKTTLVAAMARYHRRLGRQVHVFKTGPDFIDAAAEADLILVEGVMGMFDGTPSSGDLAQVFGLPVALVIDAGVMAQSFGAVALGLASYRGSLNITGVIANHIAGAGHIQMVRQSLPVSIPFLGALQTDQDIALPERRLGLHPADEIADLDQKLDSAADLMSTTELANLPPPVNFLPGKTAAVAPLLAGTRIAIVRDAAFCFVYPANLQLLQQMGADLRFFSPLSDPKLPDCHALYLPGGYPELYLDQLTRNQTMLDSVRQFCATDQPVVAECGACSTCWSSCNHGGATPANWLERLRHKPPCKLN